MTNDLNGFRCSPQQARLLALWQLHANAFYAQCEASLEGAIQPRILKAAIEQVVRRHEIFRTRFHQVPGTTDYFQIIVEDPAFHWEEIDLKDFAPAAQDEAIQSLALNQRRVVATIDDIALRALLLTTGPQQYLLILSLPALCADARTLIQLVAEISRCYDAQFEPIEPLAETAQYKQFSEWQNEILAEEEAAAESAYLRAQNLENPLPAILPFEQPKTEVATSVPAAQFELAIDSSLWLGAPGIITEPDQVPFADVLFTCWQILLWRLSGQAEIVIERIFDGRKYEVMSDICGPLARAIPLAARFRGDESFSEVCLRTRQAALDVADRQEYFTRDQPINHRAVDIPGIGFDFIEIASNHHKPGVTWLIRRLDVCAERYKLRLFCWHGRTEVVAAFHYDPSLYSTTVIERLAVQFYQLLTDAMRRPQTPIDELELLNPDEKRQLLVEFNATQQDYPAARCLHQLLEDQAQRTPQSVALAYGNEHLSYDELNRRANQLAHRLRAMGAGPEVIVGVSLERSPAMLIALLAVLKAGGAYLPLDWSLPPERLRLMLEDARAVVLITQSQQAERLRLMLEDACAAMLITQTPQAERLIGRDLQTACRIISLDDEWAQIALESTVNPANFTSPDNLAYVIFTSGSTGRPKGAMIHHRGLVNYLSWCVQYYEVAAGNGAPVHSPISFDLTITGLFAPLLAGRCVRLLPESHGSTALHQALRDHCGFSLVKLTPAHLEALSHVLPASDAAGRTRTLVVGGEELKAASLVFWRKHAPEIRVINEYGPTETVVGCCVYELSQNSPINGVVPIGQPIANTQIYVLDAQFNPVPAGMAGELHVGGVGLARGYLRRQAGTAEKFVPDPFSDQPGARLYRTGDLARHLLDGNLEFVGRIDHQVKIRSYRIEPGEIESTLRRHPAVREAVVVARKIGTPPTMIDHADGPASPIATDQLRRFVKTWSPHVSSTEDKRLVAYLIGTGDPAPTAAELRDFLSASLPDYMVPSAFVFLHTLPTNANGKLDRDALPDPGRDRSQLTQPFVPPATLSEKALAQIWAKVLGVASIGLDDNFFELGGDSIRALQVAAHAQEQGIDLSIPTLFDRPTIRQLAVSESSQAPGTAVTMSTARIKSAPFSLLSDEDRDRLPAGLDDAYPLGYIQAGVIFHTQHSPESPFYHDIFSYHLQAPLKTELFDLALAQLIARHATLRTSFDLTNFSEPLQLVHRTVPASLQVHDLRALPAAEQESAFTLWLEEEKGHRFDWSSPPQIRFFAHRLTEDSYYLSLSFHDSILDGWSTASLLTELLQRYSALLADNPLPIEPLPAITYRDFIELEREALASSECRNYWSEKLRDCVVARLPRSLDSQPGQSEPQTARRVAVVDVPISAQVSDGLKNLAQLAGVPLKHVLLAGHLKVISAISGQSDVMTALESNSRLEETGGEQTLGIHLNMLPFRLRLTGGSWVDLAQQVFAAERELLPFRRYPYPQIQKMHGGQPLFETIFNYTHFHVFQSLRALPGLKILGGRGFGQRHYPLSAEFNRDPVSDHVQLDLECDPGLLPREQWEEIGAYYASVLTAMSSDPHARYEHSDPLAPGERERLFTGRNGIDTQLPDRHAIHQRLSELSPVKRELLTILLKEQGIEDETRSRLYVAPRTQIERILTDIWSQVLRVEQIGIHDDFFVLGGDSIQSMQIVSKANQAGLRISTAQVFEHPSIAQLAQIAEQTPVYHLRTQSATTPMPLMPIQHWFFEQNFPQPHHWNQAVLLELRNDAESSLIEEAWRRVFDHHEALRLRIVQSTSSKQMLIVAAEKPDISRIDLSHLPEDRQRMSFEQQAAELQASLNFEHGPTARLALFDLGGARGRRLLIVIHHLAIDGVSLRILLDDLQTACRQLSCRETVQLPPKTLPFPAWARLLAEHAGLAEIRKQLDFWLEPSRQPMFDNAVQLPLDHRRGENTESSARSVTVMLSAEETKALLQAGAGRAKINEALLTALLQAISAWTHLNSVWLEIEGHGREEIFKGADISRTVGWFTSLFPILLRLPASVQQHGNPDIIAVVKSVQEQLRLIPDKGIGYGMLRYLSDEETSAKLKRLPKPQLIFNYLGQFDQTLSDSAPFRPAAESCGPTNAPTAERTHLLQVIGRVFGGKLLVDWSYSENFHQRSTVEGLAQSFLAALRAIIAHFQITTPGRFSPSDFPEAELTQEELDRLQAGSM